MALQKRLLLLSLIRYFIFSFPLQVYTPWWKTWIISCKVGTNFRAGHFSKSPIAENIMQIPSLSKLQKEVAIYIWTGKNTSKIKISDTIIANPIRSIVSFLRTTISQFIKYIRPVFSRSSHNIPSHLYWTESDQLVSLTIYPIRPLKLFFFSVSFSELVS